MRLFRVNDHDGVGMNETGSCWNGKPRCDARDNKAYNQNNSPRSFPPPNTETLRRKPYKYLLPECPCLFFPSEYCVRWGINMSLALRNNLKAKGIKLIKKL